MDGWEREKEPRLVKRPCMTGAEQAVSTVGGSQENGIIHVLLACSVYLSLPASLPRSRVFHNVEPALCS